MPDHGPVGFATRAMPTITATASKPMLTMFCPRYVTGRCGIHFNSCSFPAAIKLPVKVRKPRMISATIAVMRNAVRFSGPSPTHK